MTIEDLKRDDDLFFSIFTEDGDRKKKKKKKKKVRIATTSSTSDPMAYKDMLKCYGRKQLLKEAKDKNISLMGVDTTSKKAIRKAILKGLNGGAFQLPASSMDTSRTTEPTTALAAAKERTIAKEARPVFYLDGDTDDFVFTKATTRSDNDIFSGMMCLGALRKKHNPNDGFGELMQRISDKITEAALDARKAIEVTDFTVHDVPEKVEPKALPAPAKKPAPKPSEKPKAKTQEVLELSSDEVKQLTDDIDAALAKSVSKKKK